AFVPQDLGVPEDIASFGIEIAYIANSPFIGLQAIVPDQIDVRELVDKQVTGTLHPRDEQNKPLESAPIRGVTTLNDPDPKKAVVIALEQEKGEQKLLLIDPGLADQSKQPLIKSTFKLPDGGVPLVVKALRDWPMRLDPADPASTVIRDLAVVTGDGGGATVIAVSNANPPPVGPPAPAGFDESGALLAPGLSPGIGQIATTGKSPRGIAVDPPTQLALVADGTAGLGIVDLSVPGGTRDDDHDSVDDRVLATVGLGGGRAPSVTVFRSKLGALIPAVASGASGLHFLQVPPAHLDAKESG